MGRVPVGVNEMGRELVAWQTARHLPERLVYHGIESSTKGAQLTILQSRRQRRGLPKAMGCNLRKKACKMEYRGGCKRYNSLRTHSRSTHAP